jgi:hypothetical protein
MLRILARFSYSACPGELTAWGFQVAPKTAGGQIPAPQSMRKTVLP